MDIKEFLNKLDRLYYAMDILEERLSLRGNGLPEGVTGFMHRTAQHKIKQLIIEYFAEVNEE